MLENLKKIHVWMLLEGRVEKFQIQNMIIENTINDESETETKLIRSNGNNNCWKCVIIERVMNKTE